MWKIEEGSEFPILRRRSDGSQCLAFDQFTTDESGAKIPIKFRPVDARRQNFGTVVTPEGIWMIGGLLEPAADLPYRARSDMFNIEGKIWDPGKHFNSYTLFGQILAFFVWPGPKVSWFISKQII